MGKTIRNILYATVALTSFASADTSETITTDKIDEFCETVSDSARNYMTKRQDGVPIREALNSLKNRQKNTDADHKAVNILRSIIFAAYDKPRFSTPKNQKEAIEEFANTIFLECVKEMTK